MMRWTIKLTSLNHGYLNPSPCWTLKKVRCWRSNPTVFFSALTASPGSSSMRSRCLPCPDDNPYGHVSWRFQDTIDIVNSRQTIDRYNSIHRCFSKTICVLTIHFKLKTLPGRTTSGCRDDDDYRGECRRKIPSTIIASSRLPHW